MSNFKRIISKYQLFVIDKWFFVGFLGGFILKIIVLLFEGFKDNKISYEFSKLSTDLYYLFIWAIVGAFILPLVKSIKLFIKIKKYPKQTQINYHSVLNQIGDLCFNDNKEEFEKTITYLSFLRDKNILSNNSAIIAFNPNDNAINSLYDVNALISFTNAHPLEWLHPTFDFYLLNNYILSLHKENKKYPKAPSICSDRADTKYQTYKSNQNEILRQLQKSTYYNLNFSNRFYFLSLDDIKQNATFISNLISGHELCGCNLYLIDSSKYKFVDIENDNKELFLFLSSTNFKNRFDHSAYIRKTIDFAISIDNNQQISPTTVFDWSMPTQENNKLSILYKSKTGFGVSALSSADKALFDNFLCSLCKKIIEESDYLFNIDDLMNNGILQRNNAQFHISFK
ncbi:MAG: hypothetical protein LBH32_08610 [Dysgonamonadaceae bacterium]|jgi:hypothetical protein|nr:hypothetical protein [Dysgonamonadaceae bacterium]